MAEQEPTVASLLASLNEWEQNYGTTYGANRGLATTGEGAARINSLKEQLIARGVVFHWDGKEYVVDDIRGRGQGAQGPDTDGPKT